MSVTRGERGHSSMFLSLTDWRSAYWTLIVFSPSRPFLYLCLSSPIIVVHAKLLSERVLDHIALHVTPTIDLRRPPSTYTFDIHLPSQPGRLPSVFSSLSYPRQSPSKVFPPLSTYSFCDRRCASITQLFMVLNTSRASHSLLFPIH